MGPSGETRELGAISGTGTLRHVVFAARERRVFLCPENGCWVLDDGGISQHGAIPLEFRLSLVVQDRQGLVALGWNLDERIERLCRSSIGCLTADEG